MEIKHSVIKMFQFRVVLEQPKDWIDYVPLWVTAVAALLTICVAVIIAYKQGKLQKTLSDNQSEIEKMHLAQSDRRMKMDLYDRRFKVFTDRPCKTLTCYLGPRCSDTLAKFTRPR